MDLNETKAWTGEGHRHVLGQMRKIQQTQGRYVMVLEEYLSAVDLEAEQPAEVSIKSIIHGEAFVRCTVENCEYIGHWEMGNDVVREFHARKRKERAVRMYIAE